MATPIELGLVLEGEDTKEFWEDRKNPKVTVKQIELFKEAMRICKTHFNSIKIDIKRIEKRKGVSA